MSVFTAQADDDEQQAQFYEFWQQFEAPETSAEPVQELEPAQESVNPVGQNKWVYARLQVGGETLVRVLAEKFNSITVHLPGTGPNPSNHHR